MNKTALITVLFVTGILTSLISCHKCNRKDVPTCINNRIESIKKEPKRNPAAEVWKWEADGRTYYYITSDCCDQYNYLYDSDCNVVCAPDGGMTGNGDGNCPNFQGPVSKTLVWKDPR